MPVPLIDWGILAGQGLFAVLFVYFFIDSRRESAAREKLNREDSASREKTLRESFLQREEMFLAHEDKFLQGLAENTLAVTKLFALIDARLAEMKQKIEQNEVRRRS